MIHPVVLKRHFRYSLTSLTLLLMMLDDYTKSHREMRISVSRLLVYEDNSLNPAIINVFYTISLSLPFLFYGDSQILNFFPKP